MRALVVARLVHVVTPLALFFLAVLALGVLSFDMLLLINWSRILGLVPSLEILLKMVVEELCSRAGTLRRTLIDLVFLASRSKSNVLKELSGSSSHGGCEVLLVSRQAAVMVDHCIDEELTHSARFGSVLVYNLHRFTGSDAGRPEAIPDVVELADNDVLDVVIHELFSQHVDRGPRDDVVVLIGVVELDMTVLHNKLLAGCSGL